MRPRSEAANQSPTSEATIGPAAAVTAPRKRRATSSWPKVGAVALQIMAAPQSTIAPPRTRVRVTRSASTPKGRLAAAAMSEVTVTSKPTSVLLMPRSCRSWIAEAPTVAVSALASARTAASSRITRVRSLPPRAVVRARPPARPSRPAAAAATPTARRPVLSSAIGVPAREACRGCAADHVLAIVSTAREPGSGCVESRDPRTTGGTNGRWNPADGAGRDEGAVRPGERGDVRTVAAVVRSGSGRADHPQRRPRGGRLVHLRHLGGAGGFPAVQRRPARSGSAPGLRRSAPASRLGAAVLRDREPHRAQLTGKSGAAARGTGGLKPRSVTSLVEATIDRVATTTKGDEDFEHAAFSSS